MPPVLLNTAIALPEYSYSQDEIRRYVAAWLAESPEKAKKADSILANAEVERRYTVRPAGWYLEQTSVSERTRVYREEMVRLCERAAGEALAGAGVAAEEIGLIVSTSCTGLMIPSVESHLMNRMPFRATTRRQPLTELGCSAAVAAVGQTSDYLRAYPDSAALVVSAELCSLTAQVNDFSMANVVSAALFGDGAAATVVTGEHFRNGVPASSKQAEKAARNEKKTLPDKPAPGGANGRRNPRILASRSVLYRDTLDLMGFDNTDGGLKIFMLPKVPRFIHREVVPSVLDFLREQGLGRADVSHFLLHPGGRKVLEGLEAKMELSREETRLSWKVLRDYGNMSSATILFLLHHFEREIAPRPEEYGLLLAVGPGFAAEMALLRW